MAAPLPPALLCIEANQQSINRPAASPWGPSGAKCLKSCSLLQISLPLLQVDTGWEHLPQGRGSV